MNTSSGSVRWIGRVFASGLLALAVAGCGGGSDGAATQAPPVELPPDIVTGQQALAASKSLAIRVDSAAVAGPPVVEFTVTNETGAGMTGLLASDLKFNIAKLVASNGEPARWQNYINESAGENPAHEGEEHAAVQASQERVGERFGTLERLGSGRYRYTFATDITDPAANPCPAPCTDALGRPLDLSFDPGLTHRVSVQQANPNFPKASGVLDFVPAGGTPAMREVVATATCNTCHVQIVAHETAVDTRLCVTCHNAGSSTGSEPRVSLDFNTVIHRIHFNAGGAALPSVQAGVPNVIGGHDFSAVTFTQDVRNCTRCHDADGAGLATATPQGDHWKTAPSIGACSSCHDDVYFGTAPDPDKPYQTKPHSGGVMTDSSTCALCHAAGRFADDKDIALAHDFPARLKAATARFRFNIVSVTGAAAGSAPVITFSVTDPASGDAPYDIKTHPAFTAPGGASSLALKIGWTTVDFGNAGSGQNYGQPVTINALTASSPGASAGTFVATSPVALPAGLTGTIRVTMEGHPAGDVTTPGTFADRLPVKNVFSDVALTGTVLARRGVVDIAKCNVCHDTLSLHGNNRTDEIGACVVCHNPNATDAGRRPGAGGTLTGGVDGKTEESIDFKTMIHAIHAGQADRGGFRDKGITVYGFGGSVNDFSAVRFPGRLSDCATCHSGTSYTLGGRWAAPTANGILGTTWSTGASPLDPADNLRASPTAAVCSSCHDNPVARRHIEDAFSGGTFSATQAQLAGVVENCSFCHGEGRAFDVKTVHGVQ